MSKQLRLARVKFFTDNLHFYIYYFVNYYFVLIWLQFVHNVIYIY
jgi:hypothetical protein